MKRTGAGKRIFGDDEDVGVAEKSVAKATVEGESGSLVFGAVLYKMDASAVSKRRMAMSSLQNVLFDSQDALEETRSSDDRLHGQITQGKVRERVLESKSSEMYWNRENHQLPRSPTELRQIYFGKTKTSLKSSAFVAYQIVVVWLSLTLRKKRY